MFGKKKKIIKLFYNLGEGYRILLIYFIIIGLIVPNFIL